MILAVYLLSVDELNGIDYLLLQYLTVFHVNSAFISGLGLIEDVFLSKENTKDCRDQHYQKELN
jgi:hypothetical protein